MISSSYAIMGGDFEGGGVASSSLKAQLKKVGADPRAVRRTMIAAYEAEMNVVIHAHKGTMHFALDAGQLDVEVADEGPGIPDIELAMQEGYSTAPPLARELGFGAGMGLPNIKKNSDRFRIESTVGKGTRVAFTIFLEPEESVASAANSIWIAEGKCRECLRCLFACPTGALRVRGGRPRILEHLCIDCAACIGACSTGALTMKVCSAGFSPSLADRPKAAEEMALVVPPSFFAQFGAGVGPSQVLDALAELGFRDVIVTEAWERALREALIEYARHEAKLLPVISPACPTVVNLIEMRFPALIQHVAPFVGPMEAIRQQLAGRRVAFVAACPSERTMLLSKGSSIEVIAPSALRQAVLPLVVPGRRATTRTTAKTERRAEAVEGVLRVGGIRHVIPVFEAIENGLLGDVEVVEPVACEQGCFGSPLWKEDPFIAGHRWQGCPGAAEMSAKAIRCASPPAPRAGLRLDANMAEAIRKLAKIDELTKRLPGKDCGRCGAPSCAAFAEDVVLGRATEEQCLLPGPHSKTKERPK